MSENAIVIWEGSDQYIVSHVLDPEKKKTWSFERLNDFFLDQIPEDSEKSDNPEKRFETRRLHTFEEACRYAGRLYDQAKSVDQGIAHWKYQPDEAP